jgi:hypothetical protein
LRTKKTIFPFVERLRRRERAFLCKSFAERVLAQRTEANIKGGNDFDERSFGGAGGEEGEN